MPESVTRNYVIISLCLSLFLSVSLSASLSKWSVIGCTVNPVWVLGDVLLRNPVVSSFSSKQSLISTNIERSLGRTGALGTKSTL